MKTADKQKLVAELTQWVCEETGFNLLSKEMDEFVSKLSDLANQPTVSEDFKDQIIENIRCRILSEYRKHKLMQPKHEWAKIATAKIVSEHFQSLNVQGEDDGDSYDMSVHSVGSDYYKEQPAVSEEEVRKIWVELTEAEILELERITLYVTDEYKGQTIPVKELESLNVQGEENEFSPIDLTNVEPDRIQPPKEEEKLGIKISEVVRQGEKWSKKAPDSVGYWLRMNAIHRPEIHYILEDYRNPDKTLCLEWGRGGETSLMRIQDNLHKIEHFQWYGPINIPPTPEEKCKECEFWVNGCFKDTDSVDCFQYSMFKQRATPEEKGE